MNKKLILILFVAIFSVVVSADVPPDTDEMRVSSPLTFTPAEDFADYRFFLQSPIDLEELQIKKNEIKSFGSENRGGAKRYVKLIAIPKTNLKEFEQTLNQDKLKGLFAAIEKKEIGGVVELVKHSFQQDIKKSERLKFTYPTYTLERSGDSIKAVVKNNISEKLSDDELAQLNSGKFGTATIIGGTLLAVAVLLIGVFLFRRAKK